MSFSSNFDAFTNGRMVRFAFCIKHFIPRLYGASSGDYYLWLGKGVQIKYFISECAGFVHVFFQLAAFDICQGQMQVALILRLFE